jgi:hypothetical protein
VETGVGVSDSGGCGLDVSVDGNTVSGGERVAVFVPGWQAANTTPMIANNFLNTWLFHILLNIYQIFLKCHSERLKGAKNLVRLPKLGLK